MRYNIVYTSQRTSDGTQAGVPTVHADMEYGHLLHKTHSSRRSEPRVDKFLQAFLARLVSGQNGQLPRGREGEDTGC